MPVSYTCKKKIVDTKTTQSSLKQTEINYFYRKKKGKKCRGHIYSHKLVRIAAKFNSLVKYRGDEVVDVSVVGNIIVIVIDVTPE